MELRRLQYFVAVVEQGGFRGAALKLHLSQPPLTRQIQFLERSLGVSLLTRGRGGAEPTDAGRLLYEEARNMLRLAEQAAERVRLVGHGQLGRLDVGVFGSAILGAIPRVVRDFRERHPRVDVVLHSLDRAAQIRALRERRITVGFNRFFTEEPDLRWEVIQTERMLLIVPQAHRLASRKQASLRDIDAEPMILYPRSPRPGFIDHLLRLYHQRGVSPGPVQEVDDVLTASALVAAGMGLSLVTESGGNLHVPGIVHVPLDAADRATVDLCVIHRRDDDSPLLASFLEVTRAMRGDEAGTRARRTAEAARAPAGLESRSPGGGEKYMVKLVYCLRKRADVPAEKFHRYWHEQHAPLVRSVAQAIRARKYIQSHTLDTELNALFVQSRGLAPAYDGITEVWWDSLEALREGMSSPEGQDAHRALLEDERTFIDFTQSNVFMTDERPIFDL